MIEISSSTSNFEREPLRGAFGFKGGYLTELWQTIAYLEDREGRDSVGLGTQSVLWSDSSMFTSHSEAAGNALMYAVLDYALREVDGRSFETPIEMLEDVFPKAQAYARQITGRSDLRKTFTLNALVALDNAAWMAYAGARGVATFEELVPDTFRSALSRRLRRVALIPTVGYGMSSEAIRALADSGYFVVKIKLGHPGRDDDMVEADQRHLQAVHDVFRNVRADHTGTGRAAYYLDINGRYTTKAQLQRLLDHAKRIGAFDQIILVEEPFPETFEEDVSGFEVRLAADESAHTDADARRLIDMGYGAIALKPIAKTTSMSLKIAMEAHERGIPCFCADLTVNPILVDWNKTFAARIEPLPGLDVGLLETNGGQNYAHWDAMTTYHPRAGASWMEAQGGMFHLTDEFFETSGGIFDVPQHYLRLVRPTDR